ncbi:MAG: hypothetical protein EOQ75_21950 [Mesorhizobium sp.]|uniref:hypothetical protein n=1 Tax=Mesorhizobium sp. TaxID=1871066 RepID=UPI000FE74695|nr:hypothetical protein [Mesorhizobium sp.]RWH18168.1 MAG: hypothetical protein EOQ75_21950 [Mesorhizobium sp.]
MGNWDAVSIQMVWFASDARRADAAKLYSAFTGSTPDTSQTSKVPVPPTMHLSAASGAVADLNTAITVQPGRIDVVLQQVDDGSDGPVLLQHTDRVIQEMAKKANIVGRELSSVTRLALVTNLFQQADNIGAANEAAASLFGLKLPDYNVTDLAFQVNSRSPLDANSGGILVNRFLKFGVASFQSVTIDVGNQAVSPRNVEAVGANLTLDINIVPSFIPLSEDVQDQVWDKLVAETLKLREIGSVEGLWYA